ncbi:MAG: hypothetical protein IPK71_11640 [Myxococcales bacterium]|nr:hypothetical protein [Myxococcales bacterium]
MNTKLVALALVASLSSAACAVPAASDTADIATTGEALTEVGMLGVTVPIRSPPTRSSSPTPGSGTTRAAARSPRSPASTS